MSQVESARRIESATTVPPEPVAREGLGLLLGFLAVTIFGGTLPATRVALHTFTPSFVAFGRAAVAGIAAAILLAALRRRFPKEDTGTLILAGLLLVFGFPLFSSFAMQTVPASHGGVVLGILPLLTSIFAALLGGERPSPLFWICGVAGTAIVVFFAVRADGMTLSIGDLALFFAALAASIGYVISGKLSRKLPGWEVISWALVLMLPVSLAGTAFSWQPEFLRPTPQTGFAFFYLSFFSMFLGFFAWNIGLAMGGIARVGQVQLLQSFVTLAIAAALLHERVTLETLCFAVAVLLIVLLGRKARVARG